MTTAQDLLDVLYSTGLRQVALTGVIAAVERSSHSLVVDGQTFGLLRGFGGTPTSLQLVPSDTSVKVIILGGRSGIPTNTVLAEVPVAGRPLQQVADETFTMVGNYLAASAS